MIAVFLAAFFAVFMAAGHGAQATGSLDLFDFVPEDLIHTSGIVVMAIVALAGLRRDRDDGPPHRTGRERGWRTVAGSRAASVDPSGRRGRRSGWSRWASRRYRADCDADRHAVPLYRRRWLLHAVTMWGFLGLLAATMLDYGLAILGLKATGTPVPIWYPVRLLGTLAGLRSSTARPC